MNNSYLTSKWAHVSSDIGSSGSMKFLQFFPALIEFPNIRETEKGLKPPLKLSPLKTLSFFRRPLNLSQKNNDLGLIHRWIVVKFKHQVRNPIPKILTVGNFGIMYELREIPFAL